MQPLSTLLPATEQTTVVRLLNTSDVLPFQAYRSDAELAKYQGWSPMDIVAAQHFIDEMAAVTALRAGDWIQLGIADGSNGELIGDLGLYVDADESAAEIGFTLCQAAQGVGHATRAVHICLSLIFSTSQARQVRAVTDARNSASIQVLERAHFIKTATQEAEFKGAACTEFVYVFHRADT